MSQIELKGVSARYGATPVIHNLDLTVNKGECLALLGPSGCGKTTTLNLIAGFAEPSVGEIRINGRTVNGVPSHRRDTAMVFQSYALFPHMTVRDNIAFGLQMRKLAATTIAERVARALDLVQLSGLEDRYPRQLSGGQQQRVAIARAVAVEPSVLLLDEPLSNLDAQLREDMRIELAQIQRRVSITTVLVTHDQADAIAVADRIAVMRRGRIEQIGGSREIYDRPANRFVAGFMGKANLIPVTITGEHNEGIDVSVGDGMVLRCVRQDCRGLPARPILLVRPEHVRLDALPQPGANALPGKIERVTYLGGTTDVIVAVGGHNWRASVGSEFSKKAGDTVQVTCLPQHCLLFDGEADAPEAQ